MEDHNVGEDFIFFFETDVSTRKVAEITANPRVSISYYCPAERDYICIFGRAELVTDDGLRAARWRDGWENYWPAGPTDPGYVVVRIMAEALEYFDMEAKQLRKVSIPRLGA
jgi:general stress protein 26